MKKIGTLLSLLCIMNVLAAAGLVGYLFGTGRLDKQKVGAIVAIVQHKGAPEKFNEKIADMLNPPAATNPATAPATQPGLADGGTPDPTLGASAQDRLAIAAQAMQQERLRLDARAQELRNQQDLLVQKQADVEAALKKITDQKRAFEQQVAAAQKKAVDDNFQKSLDLYNELKAKQVKDLFVAMDDPNLVASFLQAMDTSRAGEIIGEFKSPSETDFIRKVLDRIRTAGTSAASGSPTAGSSGGAAAPGT
ncbi:MAG: hypothetical protein ACTHN5_03300 [Phycisphaerae bacterium]